MTLYLTRFGSHTAVIAAGSVSLARRVFVEKVTAVADRAQIRCRAIKGATHGAAVADAEPFVLQSIVD